MCTQLQVINNVDKYIKHISHLKAFYSDQYHDIGISNDSIKSVELLREIGMKFKSFIPSDKAGSTEILNSISFFYRGQKNYSYNLIASIFRKHYLGNESKIIKMVLSERPSEFSKCRTMFEKLTIMQHYGIPTRIMDITGNPLIALYFACEDAVVNADTITDGAVFLFTQSNTRLLSFDSDKLRMLSNLSLLDKFEYCSNPLNIPDKVAHKIIHNIFLYYGELFSISTRQKIHEILDFKIDYSNDNALIEALIDLVSIVNEEVKQIELGGRFEYCDSKVYDDIVQLYNYLNKFQKMCYYDYTTHMPSLSIFHSITPNECLMYHKKRLSSNKEILTSIVSDTLVLVNTFSCNNCSKTITCKNKLLDYVRSEKPFFENRIKATDLNWWYIVKSIKNNPRIQQQDGHFVITPNVDHVHRLYRSFAIEHKTFDSFGFENVIDDNEELANIHYSNDSFIHKVNIPSEAKHTIIQELNDLGINHSTVFPELHELSRYIEYLYR